MKPSTVKKLKKAGLDPKEFTSESPESLVGKVVAVDPGVFGYNKDNLLFMVTGGFGAERGLRGSAVFVRRLWDGVEGRVERHEIVAVRNEPVPAPVSVPVKGVEQ